MNSRTLLLTAAVVLLPALAPIELAQAVEPASLSRFTPPTEQFLLSRTVIRELSDGKQIKVTRRYAVQFASIEQGFQLDGKLIDVEVEVPPLLKGLAEVERHRGDVAMFPVVVDLNGAILGGSGIGTADRPARNEMTSRALGVMEQSGMPRQNLELGARFVAQVMQTNSGSPWPADLFRIGPGEHRQSRVVALASGEQGRIEVVTRVDALLPCGLPQSIERTVVTVLAGTRRVSREVWTFQPGAS
jgi:hypothetical protein